MGKQITDNKIQNICKEHCENQFLMEAFDLILSIIFFFFFKQDVVEWLRHWTQDHKVAGLNPGLGSNLLPPSS